MHLFISTDLIAVLCPFGPLRILVETSQRHEREIPALLYTVMVWMMATPGEPPSSRGTSGVPVESTITPPQPAYVTDRRYSRGQESVSSTFAPVSDYEDDRRLTDTSVAWTHRAGGEMEMDVRSSAGTEMAEVIGGGVTLSDATQGPSAEAREREAEEADTDEEEEAARGGLKLGLGDFVFYSVLVARAGSYGPWGHVGVIRQLMHFSVDGNSSL